MAGIQVDGANQKLVLDSDGDTYLEAATDDTVKVYVAGAQDFTITANTLTAESGSTIAAQALTATTVTASGIVTGSAFTAGSAVLAEAELELLDGLTAGTAIASKVVTTDANIDTTGQRNLTISGELDAATLDISGNADIDGTTNLDAVDIDGAVQLDSTLTIGADDTGHDVIFYGATAGAKLFWDESADDLILDKTILKLDQTDGNYMYLYRGGSKALVGNITDEGDASGIGLTLYNSDEDFFFKFNNTTPVLTLGASGFIFNEGSNDLDFRIETSGNSYSHMVFVESGAGEFNINESAGEGTITFNQAAEDGRIVSLKSSDVAHSFTSFAEADTYGDFSKMIATDGGLRIRGFTEHGYGAIHLQGQVDASDGDTSEGTDSLAAIQIAGYGDNGTGGTTVDADFNLFAVLNASTTSVIVKGDGEIFSNQSATVGTFDAYDDAQLVRANDLFHRTGVIDSKFDKFIKYNAKTLADNKLIGKDNDGNPTPFVNITGMQRLHNGAIWQQYEKHNQLLEAVYDLAKEAVGEDKANAILDKHEVKRLQ
jgi:hypothetical protein